MSTTRSFRINRGVQANDKMNAMSYRRKSETAEELCHYKSFRQANFDLIEQSGIPSLVFEDYDVFIYFLMHGDTWPHTHVQFSLSEMNTEQRRAYLLLLDRYFEAGFAYPGLMGLMQEERDELERKHPTAVCFRQRHNLKNDEH